MPAGLRAFATADQCAPRWPRYFIHEPIAATGAALAAAFSLSIFDLGATAGSAAATLVILAAGFLPGFALLRAYDNAAAGFALAGIAGFRRGSTRWPSLCFGRRWLALPSGPCARERAGRSWLRCASWPRGGALCSPVSQPRLQPYRQPRSSLVWAIWVCTEVKVWGPRRSSWLTRLALWARCWPRWCVRPWRARGRADRLVSTDDSYGVALRPFRPSHGRSMGADAGSLATRHRGDLRACMRRAAACVGPARSGACPRDPGPRGYFAVLACA
jgi:hypothetical protein